MNYIKGFWSFGRTTSPNGEVQSQPNTIHGTQPANFNAVTFTTTTATSGSSIIITTVPATPQNTQPILYHNNNQNINELKPTQMTSPTESYHSAVSSNFDQNNGKINLAFAESTTEINNNNNGHVHHHTHHHHHRNNGSAMQQRNQMVVREQYWTWNPFWARWTNRERIFLIVIIVLSLCVLALTTALSVVLQKNFFNTDPSNLIPEK